MSYRLRQIVGLAVSFLIGALIPLIYKLTHLNSYLLLGSTAILLVVLLVPWVVEGEWIWQLRRKR